jgi:hypothetical protein
MDPVRSNKMATKGPAKPGEPVDVAAAAIGDESGIQAAAVAAQQSNYAVLVAQFADMDSAKMAYEAPNAGTDCAAA